MTSRTQPWSLRRDNGGDSNDSNHLDPRSGSATVGGNDDGRETWPATDDVGDENGLECDGVAALMQAQVEP